VSLSVSRNTGYKFSGTHHDARFSSRIAAEICWKKTPTRSVLDTPHARGMTAECEAPYPSLRGAERRSNPFFLSLRGNMDCFAEPVIGRAHSRDPLARNDGFRTNAPHSQPSSPAKAGDPVFRDVSDGAGRPRRTGYPAGACHRARRRRDPVAGMTALRGATHPPPPHQRRSVNLGLIPANYDADTTPPPPPPPVNGSNS